MDIDLHTSINIYSSGYKVKYTSLNLLVNQNCNKYYLFINVGEIIESWDKSLKFKEESLKNKKYTDINSYIAISIMNIVAHYRHFYHSKLAANNIIYLYCDKKSQYEQYESILSMIEKICNSIPKVYFVHDIGKNGDSFYSHLLTYINIKNIKINLKTETDTETHLISGNKSDYQITSLTDNILIFRRGGQGRLVIYNKWELYENYILKHSKGLTQNPAYRQYLNLSIVPMISLFGGSLGWKMIDSFKKIQSSQRPKILEKILKSQNNQDRITVKDIATFDKQIADSFLIDDTSKSVYNNRVTSLRYQYNPAVSDIVDELLTLWTSKIKDSNITSINDMEDIFSNNPLRIDYLIEGV